MRTHGATAALGMICGLAAALAGLSPALARPPPPARPLADRELTIANHALQPATELYVSPNDAPDWGDDRLMGRPLAPGAAFRAKIGRTRACLFDAQIIYADGSREEAHDHDACRNGQIAFDGSATVGAPPGPVHVVTLANNAPRPIQQVFLSEADAAQWGEDRVTSRGLSVGDRIEVSTRGGCSVDLRVIFDNRAAEERRALDICAMPALSIEPGWTTADPPPVPAEPAKPVMATALAQPAGTARTTLLVTNGAGADLSQLYLYPGGRADQGRDLLAGAVLRAGASVAVTLARGEACEFSAHLVFAGGAPDRELKGLDVCAGGGISLVR